VNGNQSLHGVFIDVKVDEAIAGDAELAAKLEEVCPVDIFTSADGRVETVTENLDECVLCNLCVDAAPDGSIEIVKLYEQ
jgi:NAD-dependent dihydropyrimidine dehydrogenase PreA subunit